MRFRGLRLTLSILVRDKATLAGLVILGAIGVLTVISYLDLGLITHYKPDAFNFAIINLPPSTTHLMGTDDEGRDVFTRVIAALPLDIWIPFVVIGLSVIIGFSLGIIAGYIGGWVDEFLLRITDFFFAIPVLIFGIVVSAILGFQAINERVTYTALILVFVGWPIYTRLARAGVLNLKKAPYVMAARASGIGTFGILRKHILPQVLPIIVAYGTLDMGTIILAYSIFAFFGLGAAPPTPELGREVYDGLSTLPTYWWWSFFPGLMITLMALGFSLVGEGLRDAFDPRIRGVTDVKRGMEI
jgi:peptide/nickel transport system permease protein